MKILHIGKYYPPFMGGIEKVNFDIVEGLNETPGFQVDELCFAHERNFIERLKPPYNLYRLPIITKRLSTPISRQLFSVYRKLRNNYDVIHLHVPNPIASLAILLFPTKAKIVLHWHSDIVKKEQLRLKMFYNPIQRLLLKRCDKIIATSQRYAAYSKDLRDFQDKVSVIPIGIDTDHLVVDDRVVEKIKSKYKDKKIIFSLGRLTYYKGFKYLVEASRYLDDKTVIVIGGCGEDEDSLKKLANDLGVENRVDFIGRVSNDEIGAYYSAADIFCLPSYMRSEAFGVVLLEALSFGLPIVACDIEGSGVPWVNQDGISGYNVPICDPEAMANALKSIIDSPAKMAELSKNARNRYHNYFTKNKMIEAVKKLYENLYASGSSL